MSDIASVFPDLAGLVAVVTGGSGAIGAAICRALSRNGVRVVVSGRNLGPLEEIAATLCKAGGNAIPVVADVTDLAALERLREEAERRLGPVDLVVVAAGGLGGGPGESTDFASLTLERWRLIIDANLTSVFLTLKTFLPGMMKRKKGAVVTISSGLGEYEGPRNSFPATPAYPAAKAGLLMLTRHAAREAAPDRVRVNAIAPGVVVNPLIGELSPDELNKRARSVALGRIGTPNDIAEAALYLLSEASSYVTGTTLDVNGGWRMG